MSCLMEGTRLRSMAKAHLDDCIRSRFLDLAEFYESMAIAAAENADEAELDAVLFL
ncbi:protein of unknown function [Rhodovastum atsumiense]|nr:protein of unknown function [Rhodovastum atsumiense]